MTQCKFPGGPQGRQATGMDTRRLAALGRPIAGALRARAVAAAPVRDGRPRVEHGELVAGAAAPLWDDARAIAPILGAAYTHEPMQVARAAPSVEVRAHNDACVPLTHWVCDGLAELEAIAVLLGCGRLGDLDAAIAGVLDEWQTSGGEAVPRIPQLAPAIVAVLVELRALCAQGVSGEAALAAVAPLVELVEMMRVAPGTAPAAIAAIAPGPLASVTADLRVVLANYRGQLAGLGAAIDRATGEPGDRVAVAIGTAALAHQVAEIAVAIAAWIDRTGPATAAQARWRGAVDAIEHAFAGSLASVRRLVPLPP